MLLLLLEMMEMVDLVGSEVGRKQVRYLESGRTNGEGVKRFSRGETLCEELGLFRAEESVRARATGRVGRWTHIVGCGRSVGGRWDGHDS